MKKNLVLTGMMGVGKSTIGKSLSLRLKMNFIDIDYLIEKEESMSIKDIFSNNGEKYFRSIEKKITLQNIEQKNCVVSLGGGAFMNTIIREKILKNCISFWLDVKIKNLLLRLRDSSKRPLLEQQDLEKTLYGIYQKRKKTYSLANFKIDCNNVNKSLIVKRINNIYVSK